MVTRTLNFNTLTAADPYTIGSAPDNLTGYTKATGSDNARIVNIGSKVWSVTGGTQSVWYDNIAMQGDVIRCTVKLSTITVNSCGPAIVNSSGNGYQVLCNNASTRLFKCVASQLGAQIGSNIATVFPVDAFATIELRLSDGRIRIFNTTSGDVQIGSDFTDTTYSPTYAAAMSRNGYLQSLTAEYTASQTVTSINGGSPITSSQSAVAAVTTGFTGAPTTITTNVTGVTCGTISGTTNAPTWVQTIRTDGAVFPKSGTVVTYTFTKSLEAANGTQTINKDADQTTVIVASPINDDITCLFGAIYAVTGRSAANGDEVYHTVPVGMSDLVVNPDGTMEVTNAGTFACWIWTISTGVNYYYSVTITENGVVIGGGITSSGLTSSGLTIAGLTSAGL